MIESCHEHRDPGRRQHDAGPLYAARFIEPAMFLLVHLAYRQEMGQVGARLLRLDNPALIQHAS